MNTARVIETTFWSNLAATVLARVLNPSDGELATGSTSAKARVIGQIGGQTYNGTITPTWHNPPRGTTQIPDKRWENRTYEEGQAGFNFEAVIPVEAFPAKDFYRVEIEITVTGGGVAPIILEGPALSRQAQS